MPEKETFKSYFSKFRLLSPLQKFTVVFLILFGIYYRPVEIMAGFGPQHILLMALMIMVGVFIYGAPSRALWLGIIYCSWQLFTAFTLNDTIRWTTLFFSFGLVFSYVGFYNLVYYKKVFTLDVFIDLLKFIMMLAFVFCIMQQLAILAGFRSLPAINLMMTYTKKGPLACNSLYLEMSHFARFMLVCYYGYVKCSEIQRGQGRYKVSDLFKAPHRWVTIRFLWMMLTMASGTAMIALLAFSLYFITKKNFVYMIPVFIAGYFILGNIEDKQLKRSLRTIEATATFDRDQVREADGSAATRIAPLVNSFNADFTKKETWFGHGVDYGRNNNLVVRMRATLFDDYGVVLVVLSYIFAFSCAYKINSLGALFMIMGIGGGMGGNIHYGWELAMLMTVVRYFMEVDEIEKAKKQPRALCACHL